MIEKTSRTITAIVTVLILLSASVLVAVPHQALATSPTGLVVPLYVDPGSLWTQLIQVKNAHPSVPIVAVVNPNNGPGSSSDSSYVSGIQQLQAAGITVVGYVHTSYGSRSTSTLESEMNEWKNWYHVTGILFDEMANTNGYQTYYSNLSNYAKSLGMSFTIGNPGTDTLPSYIGTVDNLCIYEDVGLPSLSVLEGWHTSYAKSNFCMVAIGVGLPSQSYITSVSNYVSYVYMTNDNLPNPYDTLPSYLGNLVAELDTGSSSTAPQPPTGLTSTAVSSSQINLSWTVPSNNGGSAITGYEIDRSTNGGSTWSTLVSNTRSVTTTYSNTGLTANTAYTYRVSAINSIGTSSPSNAASATTQSGTSSTAPQSPTGLTSTAVSSSQINLSWTVPSNNGGSAITGYKIDRSTDGGSTWSVVVSNTASTSTTYSNTGLTANTTYTYRVSAINSVGTSSPSGTSSSTTLSASGGTSNGITINNVKSVWGTTSSNTITLANFAASTGSDNLLVVGVSANNNNVVSITFGGVPLTKAVSSFYNNDAEFWYLKNPSGTANIVVTTSGSTQAVIGAYSFTGVNQTNPVPTHVAKYNTSLNSPKISITTKYPNDFVVDLPSIWGGVTLGSNTCTQEWNHNISNAITGASSSSLVSSPGTVTCSWTASSGDQWDDVAIEIRADS